jgi:hypothetical protein
VNYKTRTLNPLGIRKLDVQKERRESVKAARAEAERMLTFYSIKTEADIRHFLAVAYNRGWEAGVNIGASATRGRVAEAIDKGTLLKP